MSLYQKYRPSTFDEIVGNSSSVKMLKGFIEDSNRPHVYLFTGPAGTGKTTSARILAKELGAELETYEVNTANNRGIDTARDIISQISMYPSFGNCMVYILDEAHRWTADFQNSMLKPLEDTPDHVYFILCTTDPQKLIKPLKSRCTEVKFESLPKSVIRKFIESIAEKEDANISSDTIEDIVFSCDGSPRTALVYLESAIKSGDSLEFNAEGNSKEIIDLCRALISSNSSWDKISEILKSIFDNELLSDPEKIRFAVLGYANAVLLNGKVNERAVKVLEAFSEPTYNNGKFGITLACLGVVL